MMKKFLLSLLVSCFFSSLAFATINVNTANQKELESVKGIGPVTAKAIIDYRTKNGPFKTIDDLDKVKGIGKKRINQMRSQVAVTGPNTPVVTPKKASSARAQRKQGASNKSRGTTSSVPNPMAPASH